MIFRSGTVWVVLSPVPKCEGPGAPSMGMDDIELL
jgi:hypothetical protein